ncbi:MAG: ABC transporter ATP-binding protein [Oscillospiraceae bacterium]|jgi:ATP-binding cassette subfamily B protein
MDSEIYDKEAVLKSYDVHLKWFGLPKLRPYLRSCRKYIVLLIVTGILGSCMDIILPLFQSWAIDGFVAERTLDGIWGFTALYFLTLVFQTVMNSTSVYMACTTDTMMAGSMRKAAFDHVQELSLSYFARNSVGHIHSRIMSDTDKIGDILAWNLFDGIWTVLYIIGASAVMLSLNWRLALFVIAIVPLVTLASVYFQKKLKRYGREIREVNSRITSKFNEGISGAKTIKTLVIEDKAYSSFQKVTAEMKAVSVKNARYRALFRSVMIFGASLAVAIVLWQGGLITKAGLMELGVLSVFMNYAQGITGPVRFLVAALSDMITVQVNIERFTKLMETKSEVTDRPDVIEKYGTTFEPKKENWEKVHGDVKFDDVSFKYPDGDQYVIEHFSLDVPQGTVVALVGDTGAGKSTLVNLMCRFYEPTSGRILLDGKDLRDRSVLWLHSNIGYVLQSPHLFSGTIRDNMKYGKPDATDEEIMKALELVSAKDIVDRLDKGLDTDVGESGNLLSTGEKQLISFARAIIADPPLLMLDEATSSVDTVTEKKIQSAIKTMISGRTAFMVAHRLSTIREADIILVVRDGKIIERGDHESLMKKQGVYFELYTRQFEAES